GEAVFEAITYWLEPNYLFVLRDYSQTNYKTITFWRTPILKKGTYDIGNHNNPDEVNSDMILVDYSEFNIENDHRQKYYSKGGILKVTSVSKNSFTGSFNLELFRNINGLEEIIDTKEIILYGTFHAERGDTGYTIF
ncbi:MAG TPA: hypothetical protein DCX27_03125, partial [Balneola sp.]|nr:hypothetical protein [Balneola sp.]